MTDRRLRTLTAIAILSLVPMTVRSFSSPSVAQAQPTSPRETCVWTYTMDGNAPNIGANGVVELKGKNWQKLSEDGWKLKAASNTGGSSVVYLFEKCQ